jgi:hypothetical protein
MTAFMGAHHIGKRRREPFTDGDPVNIRIKTAQSVLKTARSRLIYDWNIAKYHGYLVKIKYLSTKKNIAPPIILAMIACFIGERCRNLLITKPRIGLLNCHLPRYRRY